MEKFLYECRPHFYVGLSTWTFFRLGDSKIAMASAMVLLSCGLLVLQMRQEYRQRYRK